MLVELIIKNNIVMGSKKEGVVVSGDAAESKVFKVS